MAGIWKPLPPGIGLASVDEQTPQLGIFLRPEHQHQGHGTKLMHAALGAARSAGYRQVSLTVRPENPAIVLYGRCGFKKHGLRNDYHLMIWTMTEASEQLAEPHNMFLSQANFALFR